VTTVAGPVSRSRVRARLIELGWYTATQLESFDDKQVIAHIFKPGFSTAESLSAACRPRVGLDVVQANVQRLGARMMLSSTPGQFTEFRIALPAEQAMRLLIVDDSNMIRTRISRVVQGGA
jgi:two-component system chemotaxis sensor kinase CheA